MDVPFTGDDMKNLFLYKIEGWWHFLGFILMGFFFNYSFNLSLFFYIILGFCLLALMHLHHDRKRFWLFYTIPIIISTIFLSSFQLFIVVLLITLVVLYNKWLQNSPIGFFLKTFGFPLLFFIPFFSLSFSGFLFYLPLCFITGIGELFHEANHFQQDVKEGKFTMAMLLGCRISHERRNKFKTCIIFIGILLLVSLVVRWYV